MGNAATPAYCCNEKFDEDSAIQIASIATDEMVKIEDFELPRLQGGWYRKTDGTKLGDMIDQVFLWDARIRVGVDSSTVDLFANRLSLTLMGQRHEAVLSLHAQPTLTWEDGDVWVLKWVFNSTSMQKVSRRAVLPLASLA